MSKCCCKIGGYSVKDADARRRITVIEEELDGYIKPSGKYPEIVKESGTYDVTQYESIEFEAPEASETPSIPEGYVKPEGTKIIQKVTQNGTTIHNVAGYEKVNIQLTETPLKIEDLTQNGTYIDVSNYKWLYLNIPTFDGSGEA